MFLWVRIGGNICPPLAGVLMDKLTVWKPGVRFSASDWGLYLGRYRGNLAIRVIVGYSTYDPHEEGVLATIQKNGIHFMTGICNWIYNKGGNPKKYGSAFENTYAGEFGLLPDELGQPHVHPEVMWYREKAIPLHLQYPPEYNGYCPDQRWYFKLLDTRGDIYLIGFHSQNPNSIKLLGLFRGNGFRSMIHVWPGRMRVHYPDMFDEETRVFKIHTPYARYDEIRAMTSNTNG